MSVAQRTRQRTLQNRSASRSIGLVSIAASLAMAGCSASITRLDAPPSFALGSDGAKSANTNTRPPSRQVANAPFDDGPTNVYGSTPRNGGNVEMANLPPLTSGEPTSGSASARAMAVTRQPPTVAAPAAAPVTPSQTVARGQQIDVQPGDTLYGIGKRHKVLISDLMAVNELKNPNLKPGQKLYLPAGNRSAANVVKPQRPGAPAPLANAAPAADSPAPASPVPAAAPAPLASAETYTVKPGDSLYAIAAKHKIKVLELQRANDVTDVRKVQPGMVLKIPAVGGASAPSAVDTTASAEPRIVRTGTPPPPPAAVPATGAAAGFKVLNGDAPRQVAAAEQTTRNDASPVAASTPTPAAAAATGKLRWPVRGRVVQGFGPRADGTHNDGVDIAVPAGTDVLAAEGGVVAYAGNEVKTYGNLVLIRHDNGWVTAYAYNEKILVNRGDRVKRGQAIAKAGKTGSADQPQLHFEVRVGSKPVDPTGYLERM